MNERGMTATAAVAELDAMKKTTATGSKPLGTNALKDHIKKLWVDAAKTAALTTAPVIVCSVPSQYSLFLYADSFLLLSTAICQSACSQPSHLASNTISIFITCNLDSGFTGGFFRKPSEEAKRYHLWRASQVQEAANLVSLIYIHVRVSIHNLICSPEQ